MVLPRRIAARLALAALPALVPSPAEAQVGTTFTYQGRLTDASVPANGAYDFQFSLHTAASGGSQVGVTLTRNDVAVINGLFTVTLDFSNVFSATRFLEMGVRPGASTGAYTTLAGRQELTAAPNAVFSAQAPWNGLTGVPAGFADGIDNDAGGDITDVTAGTGLTGGGASGPVSLAVDFAGSGSSNSSARSDHTHFTQSWTGAAGGGQAGLTVNNTGGVGLRGTGSTGVSGSGTTGAGVSGSGSPGVYGSSSTGIGVTGISNGAGSGVDAFSSAGDGVRGAANGTTGDISGVYGSSNSSGGQGVRGQGFGGAFGVRGTSGRVGVSGVTSGTLGTDAGVYGASSSTATTAGATGVWGVAGHASSYAGYFSGRAHVNGTLSKSAGSFKIDHPLDPENKYLSHSFVESPDMMNVYNGNVVLDADGEAEVALSDWFEALNKDFRYQLTPIGGPGPGLHVAREVSGNRFRIAGGSPGLKVSWQVTGIRRDAYAEKNRIPVEEMKPEQERGVYLQPEAHGLPAERGLDHRRRAPHLDDPRGERTAPPAPRE